MLGDHPSFSSDQKIAPREIGPNNADMQRAKELALAKEAGHARASLRALGKRVEKLRLEVKGWNRTTLAEKAGVTITTIRGCEQGTKVTQPEKLKDIARALGVSVRRLEADDTKDPRVQNWNDEDYEIGKWYHHASRALKNRIWALHEIADAGAALLDPQFVTLLEGWAKLDQEYKKYVLNAFTFGVTQKKNPDAHGDTGGVDAPVPADAKTRGPQR